MPDPAETRQESSEGQGSGPDLALLPPGVTLPSLTPAQQLLRRLVLDSVMAPTSKLAYCHALNHMFGFAAGRPLTRLCCRNGRPAWRVWRRLLLNVRLSAVRKLIAEARWNGMLGVEEAANLSDTASKVDLEESRRKHRMQQLMFECAQRLTREYCAQPGATIAPHTLFPQLVPVVERYLRDSVEVLHGGDRKDAFLSPYFGWLIETLREHIRPDQAQGEAPEIPRYEENRMEGSTADVDTWTSKEVRQVTRSHVNFVIADTRQWEQAAAFILDTHARVEAFVKNAGLGFGIPYLHNGQMHDYVPDFLVRLKDVTDTTIILETKGFDPLAEVKASAAARWVNAVNAEGSHGRWQYELARSVSSVGEKIVAIQQ